MRKLFLVLLIVLFIVPVVSAQRSGSMKLLAVQQIDNQTETGSVADLTLEIIPGTGRVFLDSFPFTKLDTQISTRFANRVACAYFELDCKQYDFVYTLHSTSSIIGGPSAGAAMAALTVIVMEDLPLDDSIAITATINSGGIIGPVGGYEEKIEAASEASLKTVLVSQGARFQIDEQNETTDLKDNGAGVGVNVIEVDDLNSVVYYFSGKRLLKDEPPLSVNSEYQTTMEQVSNILCERRQSLYDQLEWINYTQRDHLRNFSNSAHQATQEGNYYSAASFCFGGNIAAKRYFLEEENISEEEFGARVFDLRRKILNMSNSLRNLSLDSINDLQTYTIVAERLKDAHETLERSGGDDRIASLAYAEERFFSALSWAEFFRLPDKELKIDSQILLRSCQQKIQEALELYQYITLYVPHFTSGIRSDIDVAESLLDEEDYALCLMRASQAKAEASSLLASLSIQGTDYDQLIDQKLLATERSISRTQRRGVFPILGYSYYEYSQSLRNSTPASSLLYSEYALELSNLDIYFEEESSSNHLRFSGVDSRLVVAFVGGTALGIALTLLFFLLKKPSDAAPKRNIRGKKR